MSPREIADRILASLLAGQGPILLCVPGTLGAPWQSSMLATARAFVQQANGPVSIASLPYPNGIANVILRFLHIGTDQQRNVLALVLAGLREHAGGRPVLLAGESQGAWLIAETLRHDPTLAAAVTRVALFAKPGFVRMPDSVGTARSGAGMLPGSSAGDRGVVEWRHVDDVVPSLFHRLGPAVAGGYLDAIAGWMSTGEYEYPPHHYDMHGAEAARWLLLGSRPAQPAHHSRVHRSGA